MASAGHFDPFGDDLLPDGYEPLSPEEAAAVRQGKGRKPLDPIGSSKRRKRADTESLTRNELRKRGYVYGRTENAAARYGGTKDLFGFVDGIAVGNGEMLLVQTTTKANKASHIKKLRAGTFKIGNGTPTPIRDAALKALDVPGVRLVLMLWHQPGGKGSPWLLEEIEVTKGMVLSGGG